MVNSILHENLKMEASSRGVWKYWCGSHGRGSSLKFKVKGRKKVLRDEPYDDDDGYNISLFKKGIG